MNVDRSLARRVVPAALLALAVTGCSWFTDFKNQPKVEPWESTDYAGSDTVPFRGNPQTSVPITGEPVPGYVVSYANTPAAIDSMSGLKNPTPPTAASLANGRKYYQINCAVCHGPSGAGNGPAVKYGIPAPDLLLPTTQNRTDGYIFGMIRNGRGLMPTYDRIEYMDRWDVVNYIRALQGKLPGVKADTTPVGYPGQNGATVPGPTLTAPTRPAPYQLTGPGGLIERLPKSALSTLPAADSARAAQNPGVRP